jgi:hypothetical protein
MPMSLCQTWIRFSSILRNMLPKPMFQTLRAASIAPLDGSLFCISRRYGLTWCITLFIWYKSLLRLVFTGNLHMTFHFSAPPDRDDPSFCTQAARLYVFVSGSPTWRVAGGRGPLPKATGSRRSMPPCSGLTEQITGGIQQTPEDFSHDATCLLRCWLRSPASSSSSRNPFHFWFHNTSGSRFVFRWQAHNSCAGLPGVRPSAKVLDNLIPARTCRMTP